MTLLIVLGIAVTYLAAGWFIAVRNLPRAWAHARRDWYFDSGITGSVKTQTVAMCLFWPLYLPLAVLSDHLTHVVEAADPEVAAEELRKQRARIKELERELGIR